MIMQGCGCDSVNVGTVYLGVMNQFGLGISKNTGRAERYYEHALSMKKAAGEDSQSRMVGGGVSNNKDKDNSDALEVLPTQLKVLVRSLLWTCQSRIYQYLSPVSVTVEYAVHLLWGVDRDEAK
jgi:TPR repeat protein